MNFKFTKEIGLTILFSAILFGAIGFFAGKYFQKQESMKNFQNRQGRMDQGNNNNYQNGGMRQNRDGQNNR